MTEMTPVEHIRRLKPPTPRTILLIVATLVVLWLLYLARTGLLPFMLGVVLVYILSPVVRWLAVHGWRRHGQRGWSTVFSSLMAMVLLVVGVIGLFIVIFEPLLAQVGAYLRALPGFVDSAQSMVESLGLPTFLEQPATTILVALESIQAGFSFRSLIPAAQTVFESAFFLLGFAAVPFFTFYVLMDAGKLESGVGGVIPEPWRPDVFSSARIFNDRVGGYVRGIIMESVVMGIMVFGSMLLLGVIVSPVFFQYAIFLAIIAAIMEVLPMIGIFIALVPAVLVAASIGPQAVVAVLIVYGILSQVEGSIVTPKVQSSAVELHPALVMMVILLGFHIGGIVVALISIPFIAAGRDIVRYMYLRLGDDPPGPQEALAMFILPREPIRVRRPKAPEAAESQT